MSQVSPQKRVKRAFAQLVGVCRVRHAGLLSVCWQFAARVCCLAVFATVFAVSACLSVSLLVVCGRAPDFGRDIVKLREQPEVSATNLAVKMAGGQSNTLDGNNVEDWSIRSQAPEGVQFND